MVPYSFIVTSHFIITLGLSLSLFIGITIVGFQTHVLHFFSILLPQGVHLSLAPFLVLFEPISYYFRALSRGISLFANIMASHSLVNILSRFAWTMLSMGDIMYLAHLVPFLIVFASIASELGVAILQAYVFIILICIYLNDAINLH
jgi:F-type H+-transporting ATPase subunit a